MTITQDPVEQIEIDGAQQCCTHVQGTTHNAGATWLWQLLLTSVRSQYAAAAMDSIVCQQVTHYQGVFWHSSADEALLAPCLIAASDRCAASHLLPIYHPNEKAY